MRKNKNDIESSDTKSSGKSVGKIILSLFVILAVLFVYRLSLNFSFFPYVMWSYMLILTILVIAYIIYNRAFTRRGVTREMLPDDWDEEIKTEFVQSGADRLRRSKWLLVLILAFIVTFLVDVVELFIIQKFF